MSPGLYAPPSKARKAQGLTENNATLRVLTPEERLAVEAMEFEGKRSQRQRNARVAVRYVGAHVRARGTLHLPRLARHYEGRHSPDGFEWGYAGSGPAELARAILMLAFPGDGPAQGVRHPANYQRFKEAVVQGLPKGGWVLSGHVLLAWYDGRLVRRQADETQEPTHALGDTGAGEADGGTS